ncbi:hypothetical protein SASPL_131732 [Salvia splendens]|uniref:Uncharacterized protein n=1 Tax=Salvia splendens TaxID=180675 RepID=A0A8X8X7Z1_SALSN|nr:hypothetical protein SASPL_131732 [Salvia splendens]
MNLCSQYLRYGNMPENGAAVGEGEPVSRDDKLQRDTPLHSHTLVERWTQSPVVELGPSHYFVELLLPTYLSCLIFYELTHFSVLEALEETTRASFSIDSCFLGSVKMNLSWQTSFLIFSVQVFVSRTNGERFSSVLCPKNPEKLK